MGYFPKSGGLFFAEVAVSVIRQVVQNCQADNPKTCLLQLFDFYILEPYFTAMIL